MNSEKLLDNNPSESVNAILKKWCNNRKLTVDTLCQCLKQGVLAQMAELKKGYLSLSQKFMLKEPKLQATSELYSNSTYISAKKTVIELAEEHQHNNDGEEIEEIE